MEEKDYVGAHPYKKKKINTKRGLNYFPRILLTGSTGFLGGYVKESIESNFPNSDIIDIQGRKFFDLTVPSETQFCFKRASSQGPIHKVVHLAAFEGNASEKGLHPASFFFQNTLMGLNVIEESAINKVSMLVIPVPSDVYSSNEKVYKEETYKEENLFDGVVDANGMARRNTILAANYYKAEFGLPTQVIVLPTVIGSRANCENGKSNILISIIDKLLEAIHEGYTTVTVFGDPTDTFDFIDANDAAGLISIILSSDNLSYLPMNISKGTSTTLTEIVDILVKETGFTGKIHFDKHKNYINKDKILDNSNLNSFLESHNRGYSFIKLEDTIKETIRWYKNRVLGN